MGGAGRWSWIAVLGLILACLGAVESHADPPPYTPQILPPCVVLPLAGGGEVCGYRTIEEVRLLYLGDVELVEARALVLLVMSAALQPRHYSNAWAYTAPRPIRCRR